MNQLLGNDSTECVMFCGKLLQFVLCLNCVAEGNQKVFYAVFAREQEFGDTDL